MCRPVRRIIGEAIGRPLRWQEVSRAEGRAELLADGVPLSFVDILLDTYAELVVAQPPPVTSIKLEVTGSPARTFREWVLDHAENFCR
ncbi:hypothetical protein F0L68_40575 [Solihabitans fulvus]|uniref:NmrA-like family protein n=1 Tax=Solihabitans fulvus TaxID=1892852 RepID=A0A5B2W5X8_9PSEU|nr:hypothetical protein [Solihabitans fulvus]KAA2246765.1 hypothetical protein F0L68_40575 [Solihabitans fulvus]